ncbi:MAG: hypothetical protein HLUCCO07_03430 [Rhodobacteraceae bacterium HLUCCO07]|nr:MAG: hypothetical protein HLUCCO07_03430 [Rhodobacteraceae bacterium HLUCCO07]
MAFASKQAAGLVLLAECLATHEGVTVDAISARALGKGHFFKRLSHGGDCRTATAERVLAWFHHVWPETLAWPDDASGFGVGCRSSIAGLHGVDEETLTEIANLPIWKNGRRPRWWSDVAIRKFLTDSHRQMSLMEAEKRGTEMFGNRCPKKSAIHDYWQRLDQARRLGAVSSNPNTNPKEAA